MERQCKDSFLSFGEVDAITDRAKGLLRASYRFAMFIAITLHYCVPVMMRSLVRKVDAKEVAIEASGWAKDLCRFLGVQTHITGNPSGGAMLLSNHRSYIDIVAILSTFPCAVLAKAEVGRWPFVGWATKVGNTIFVDREDRSSRSSSRRKLAELLQQSSSVTVFPEGTTSAGPGILSMKKGMFHLAAESGFSIVPTAVYYDNPNDAWVGNATFLGHFFSCFGKPEIHVHVAFGPVLKGSDGETLHHETERWIVEHLNEQDHSNSHT